MLLDVSRTLTVLLSGGCQHLTVLSLWPAAERKRACLLSPPLEAVEARLFVTVTKPLWCLVLCLGSTLLRMESAETEDLPLHPFAGSKSAMPQVPVQGSLCLQGMRP